MTAPKARDDDDLGLEALRKRPNDCADCGRRFLANERGYWVGFGPVKRAVCARDFVARRVPTR